MNANISPWGQHQPSTTNKESFYPGDAPPDLHEKVPIPDFDPYIDREAGHLPDEETGKYDNSHHQTPPAQKSTPAAGGNQTASLPYGTVGTMQMGYSNQAQLAESHNQHQSNQAYGGSYDEEGGEVIREGNPQVHWAPWASTPQATKVAQTPENTKGAGQ